MANLDSLSRTQLVARIDSLEKVQARQAAPHPEAKPAIQRDRFHLSDAMRRSSVGKFAGGGAILGALGGMAFGIAEKSGGAVLGAGALSAAAAALGGVAIAYSLRSIGEATNHSMYSRSDRNLYRGFTFGATAVGAVAGLASGLKNGKAGAIGGTIAGAVVGTVVGGDVAYMLNH